MLVAQDSVYPKLRFNIIMRIMGNLKGFSLVELLVVVAIIGILMTVVLMSFSKNPEQKARDAVRKQDVNSLADAYEIVASNENKYRQVIAGDVGMGKIPSPPEGGNYQVSLDASGQWYMVCANLEKGKDLNCLQNSDNPNCYCRKSRNAPGGPSPSPSPDSSGVLPSPSPSPIPNLVAGYTNDQTKLLKTYAVFFFEYPGFPPPPGAWSIHFSLRSDFGGDYTQTHRSFATATDYTHTGPANASYSAYRKLTQKYVSFQSLAGEYDIYRNNCGKTVYWRVSNYYSLSATDKKDGPTYIGVVDCATKVGVVDPPLSWFSVYDQLNNKQKQYDSSWDFDNNGTIDWTDYWLGAFSTKTRYGGWQSPE
jgi:prepilin-type N-terminal cleavage/methylation domain-containing protein